MDDPELDTGFMEEPEDPALLEDKGAKVIHIYTHLYIYIYTYAYITAWYADHEIDSRDHLCNIRQSYPS